LTIDTYTQHSTGLKGQYIYTVYIDRSSTFHFKVAGQKM
jgi:hypothetical protein